MGSINSFQTHAKILKILLQVAGMHGLHMVLKSCTCLKDIDVDVDSYIMSVFYISHSANMFLNEILKVVF